MNTSVTDHHTRGNARTSKYKSNHVQRNPLTDEFSPGLIRDIVAAPGSYENEGHHDAFSSTKQASGHDEVTQCLLSEFGEVSRFKTP